MTRLALCSLISLLVACAKPMTQPRVTTGNPLAVSAQDEAYERGKGLAAADIRAGKLKIKAFGKPVRWREEYATILTREYGIEFEVVAGCLVSDELVAEVRGYNEVATQRIEERFGQGILDKVSEQAQAEYDAERLTDDE